MQSKAFLIAIAAFAVTATGVQAYGGAKIFARAGLSEQQIEAFEVAHELHKKGEGVRARDVLVEAGVDETTLSAVQTAAREARHAILRAVDDKDFVAFTAAIVDMPLADIITTERDFALFVEAHELRKEGSYTAADEIFADLGVEPGRTVHQRGSLPNRGAMYREQVAHTLSSGQHDALRAARQANDRATMEAILSEAGITTPWRMHLH